MTFPSREAIRDAWVELLEDSGDFDAVYGYQPDVLLGATNVATVHAGRFEQEEVVFGGSVPDVRVTLIQTNLVRRDDPEAAEDALDALLAATGALVTANRADSTTGLWQHLQLERGEPDYFLIDGKQYRGEIINLVFTVYQ